MKRLATVVGLMVTIFVAGSHAWRPAPTDFVWISAGDHHTCASQFNGTTWCWGQNDKGQLGNGVGSILPCPSGKWCLSTPLQVPNHSFGQVAAGGDTTCALASGGTALCWGDNSWGQVGANSWTTSFYVTPQAVSGSYKFIKLAVSSTGSCGLSQSGVVTGLVCWGGVDAASGPSVVPVMYAWSYSFWDLAVSNGHVCMSESNAVASDIQCAGFDPFGQPGVDPTHFGRLLVGTTLVPFMQLGQPVFSSLGSNAGHVAAGGSASSFLDGHPYTCADQTSGVVQCVGNNDFGQLGLGFGSSGLTLPNGGVTFLPQTVGNGIPLMSVTTGMSHACAINPYTSLAWCWGLGTSGELGNSNFVSNTIWSPQLVNGGLAVRSITAGMSHTCAIGTDNHIYCWGDNSSGQLGVPTSLHRTSIPQRVL